jgi:NAD+ synthase
LKLSKVSDHIVNWLSDYCEKAKFSGFVIGISGGVDSALTSMLCSLSNKKVILISMPIRQTTAEFERANKHIQTLKDKFINVESIEVNLTDSFSQIEKDLPAIVLENHLAMANSRARLRMLTLYAIAQANNCLVVGTGNKVEDFGVGFYTKYGDGGVDISPIADLTKTQVWALAKHVGVIDSILIAKPTDGLFEDGRSDEDQIGATYPELEWAMEYSGDESSISPRQQEVLRIYRKLNKANLHKMEPIPVCIIPTEFKSN